MATANIFDLTDTWNAGATTFTAVKMNVTDTASASGSLLLDLQVGGVSRFHVTKDGNIHGRGSNYNIAYGNNTVITASNYSLTGSNASSMLDLAGTWNTTGTPTAIKTNITDTASNAASLLIDLQTGGTSRFSVSKVGRATLPAITLAGNLSQAAWTTTGIGISHTARTLTDTSSSGTVATAYTNVLGGNTIAANSSTTYTDYATLQLGDPAAGTNVTITNALSLVTAGAVRIGGSIRAASVDLAGTQAADSIGTRGVPQNSQSTAYTLVIGDAGKHILHPSADTTARTFTIPANSSVAFAVGTVVSFINQASAGVITIAITTDTMRLAGAGTTGSRTLAANGIATAIKLTSTEWLISGTGLT